MTSGIAILGAIALTAACGGNGDDSGDGGGDLSGDIAGSGATSMENAQEGWRAGFEEANDGVTVTYDPTGSSTGREQFLGGSVLFAGSDSPLKEEEITKAKDRCSGGEALEMPLYISPIAVVYNLPGVKADNLKLTPDVVAGIFMGTIKKWNDPAIAATNEGVALPDLAVVPVNRSDGSGTTENFQEYLKAAAPSVWTHEPSDNWPISGTQGAAQTAGMADVVGSTEGAIGYIDASRAGDLGTVAIGVGSEFVPFSPEAAAAVVDASERTEDATDKRLTIELARDTKEAGAYPIVLISYLIACDTYEDQADASNVAAYLKYIASEEGQARAAEPDVAGSAPISDALHGEIEAAIDTIKAAG